jgi:hypothetical protein
VLATVSKMATITDLKTFAPWQRSFYENENRRDLHRHHRSGVRGDSLHAPLGSVGYENEINERGERLIWLDRAVVDRLRWLRGPGESYSDVILRVANETTPTKRAER